MSKLDIYDMSGKQSGDLEIADKMLVLDRGAQAVQDSVVAEQAAQRAGTASTKRKGEVSGSNRKPWRQKGTGRARAGFKQSPVWRGGGVAFGPHPRSYRKKINKKTNRLAFARALSEKISAGDVRVVEKIDLPEPKTKLLASFLDAMEVKGRVILVLDQLDKNIILAAQNMPRVEIVTADTATTCQLLAHQTVVADVPAIEQLKIRLGRVSGATS